MSTLVQQTYTDAPLKPRRERLWLDAGKKCHWCKRSTRLVGGDDPDQATTDHIVPRYKGGSNEDDNCVSACRDCNGRRNHEDIAHLPEGHLLGKDWKSYTCGSNSKPKRTATPVSRYVALTGDEKKAILARFPSKKMSSEEVLREQRDAGLKRISELEKELIYWKTTINKLQSQSLWNIIRQRLALWLLREKEK